MAGQRRLHRVPRTTNQPRNLRNRHALRLAQPSDLSPVLHDQHLLPPRLDSGQGHGEAGQFSLAAPWSVFSCRRQTNSVPTVAQALVPLSHYCRRQPGPGYLSLALLAMLLHRRRYGSDGAVWSTDLLPATWAQTPGCIDRDHEAKQVRLWTGA